MLIGIDVGTTSVKAILFDGAGTPLETYAQPYETRRGERGLVEQDPDVWVTHIRRALAAFNAARDLSGLAGIGICSQVNTHVFVDANGNALAPAIVWQDGRAGDAAAALDRQISDDQRMAWWGAPMPIDASHCLARMRWMADTRPDVWARTKWVMLAKDYCLLQLTGEAVSDPIANVGMVEAGLGYIGPLLALVPGAAERLPPLAPMHSVAGKMRAGEVGAGVPVAVGTMDAWGGMFGVGAHRAGTAMYLSGTSEVLGINSAEIHPTPGVIVFPTVDGITLHAAPTQAGGAAKLWACGLLGVTPDEMSEMVAALDPDERVPLFLPHLQGERAPVWDIDARGTFLGLDGDMGPAAVARGVYTGVALSARWALEALDRSAGFAPETLNCGGGGFRSAAWNQIRADVLGRALKRLAVADAGVLGAAGLAAVAGGVQATLDQAFTEIVRFDRSFVPDAAQTARYDEMFGLYKEAYEANRGLNAVLARGAADGPEK